MMMALTYPWLIGLLVFVAIVFSLKKRFLVCGIVIVMALALNWYSECVALNVFGQDKDGRGKALRVLTWNINTDYTDSKEKLQKIADVIFVEDPDVVFVAEVMWMAADTLTQIMDEKYPYTTIVRKEWNMGHYIYSKYPLGEHRFINSHNGNGFVLNTNVALGDDSLNLYGCHLASNNYDAENKYMTPDSIENRSNAFKYLKNIERTSRLRKEQCDSIVADIRKHEGASIVMGDMNDVCGSPCIRVLEDAGLKDAWWEGGLGYGATFHQPLSYRIDHVLYSEGFRGSRVSDASLVSGGFKFLEGSGSTGSPTKVLRLKGIRKVDAIGLSDHDALVADFELR